MKLTHTLFERYMSENEYYTIIHWTWKRVKTVKQNNLKYYNIQYITPNAEQ